jgi:hypothetical protein
MDSSQERSSSAGSEDRRTDPKTGVTNRRSDTTGAADRDSSELPRVTDAAEARVSEGVEPDDGDASERSVLLSMDEYRPGMTVRVVGQLLASTVVDLLELPTGETVPVLSRPDEYTGYVVRSEPGRTQVWSTMIVFTRESLEIGACYVFEADAQVFSTQLYLLRTTVHRIGSADSAADGNDGD